MQTVLFVVLSIAAIVVAAAFAVLVSGILREARRIGRTCEDVSEFLKRTEEELTSTARDARTALGDIDQLLVKTTETVSHIEKVSEEAERLLSGAHMASAAAKAVQSSKAGVFSVYEGVKQGIRTLWGLQETNKEGTSDEQ